MSEKRLVLIGYPAVYFVAFGRYLAECGFDVYWICGLASDARHLVRNGVHPSRVLDVNVGFRGNGEPSSEERSRLSEIETLDGPMINDLIMMDRILRKKSSQFAYRYLSHLQRAITHFLRCNRIVLATSWRDTALQLLGMMICRQVGIPWVVPTRIRIPQELYGFCTGHFTDTLLQLRETTDADIVWAEEFLAKFESRAVRPALKKATRTFADILFLLPSHARAFGYEFRRSFIDAGNDYARYTVPSLIGMYIRRRCRLARYKLSRPAVSEPPQAPFCLYALHTQPESSIDVQASFYSDQVAVVRLIARSLPVSYVLAVKVHPTDVDGKPIRYYRELSEIPGVVLLDYSVDSRLLIERAAVVFALTGTIAYEAALLRKPVIVFTRNFFNLLPTVHLSKEPMELPALVRRVISDVPSDRDNRKKIIRILAAWRASTYDGEVSRTYGASNERLRPSDLEQLRRAYSTLAEKVATRNPR